MRLSLLRFRPEAFPTQRTYLGTNLYGGRWTSELLQDELCLEANTGVCSMIDKALYVYSSTYFS